MSSTSDAGAAPVRLGWWLSSEEHDPRALVEHAASAEEAGFRSAMLSDHLQPWVAAQGNAPYAWTVIGALSRATRTLEVGTGVTSMIYRQSPVSVAQAAATAAVMLEGRFFLGVGTGERLNEQAFGRRWPRAGERREQLAEAVPLIRSLLDGGLVNHRGQWWSVENLRLTTLPAVPPPILIAASGPRSAQLAGEAGDGMIGVAPDARLVERFHSAGGTGRRCVAQLHLSLAATSDSAEANAWRWWPQGVVPTTVLSELARPTDFEAVAMAAGPGRLRDTVVCATEAGPVVAAIDRFVGAGFDTIFLHQVGPDQRRLLDLATAELLPHYAS